MDAIDTDALKRALVACRAESAGRAKQIDGMLIDRPWERVARFAAYSVQIDSLGLMPWQKPPCKTNLDSALREPFGEAHGRREAGEMLQRLLNAGLSRFEPNPIAALERAEQRQAVKSSGGAS